MEPDQEIVTEKDEKHTKSQLETLVRDTNKHHKRYNREIKYARELKPRLKTMFSAGYRRILNRPRFYWLKAS